MLVNKTKNKILAKRIRYCNNLASRSIGLMFSRKKNIKDAAVVLVFKKEKIMPLHMFFVFFPIDVLFLDKNKEIIEIKENFRPFSFYKPLKKARYVIELQAGVVKKSKTKIKDLILLK